MGIPTDPDDNGYEAGDDCGNCWGPGKPFGDVETPKYVVATFDGVIACEGGFAPDGPYSLTQTDHNPCFWKTTLDNGFIISWATGPNGGSSAYCGKGIEPVDIAFFGVGDPCDTLYTNDWVADDCPGVQAYGGTCQIS